MSGYKKRSGLLKANTYQRPIIGMTLAPTFVLCALLTVFVLYLHRELINYITYQTTIMSVDMINQWGLFILVMIWTFFIVVYVWAQLVSNKLVGAFERINRELDHILEGSKVGYIKAREGDYIAVRLLDRINSLIKMANTAKTANEPTAS